MCGFVGVIGSDNAAIKLYQGLLAVQHRGQDSAGIGTMDKTEFHYKKDLGKVQSIFNKEDFQSLPGTCGVGHVRYPTIGGGKRSDSQPFFARQPGILMVHNGNIINYSELKEYLLTKSYYLSSTNDIEPVLYIFSHMLNTMKGYQHTIDDAVEALKKTYGIVKGAYSIAAVLWLDGKKTLMLARDPHGIRPAVWSKKDNTYFVASESVCIDAIAFDEINEIEAGQVAFFRPGEKPIIRNIKKEDNTPCIFEYIYFARPDSIMGGRTVYDVRLELGQKVAREWQEKNLDVDLVIPIPDTSRPASIAFAETIGKPLREGFIKNRYIGRTFILSSQHLRESALNLKLNPIASEIEGKKIVLVDDSIVRGNTLKRTIKIVKQKNPKEVHVVIYAPPVIHPCFYGIDMSTEEELIANKYAQLMKISEPYFTKEKHKQFEELMREEFDVDSLTYLTVDGLNEVCNYKKCAACFDGTYPLEITQKFRDEISSDRTKKDYSLEDYSKVNTLNQENH